MNIIYNTDRSWFDYLKKNGLKNNVNFWRKDSDTLAASTGSPFYFKIRGTRLIAGRAKYSGQKQMKFPEAWETFGVRNGVNSYPEFVDKLINVTGATENEGVNCLVLDKLEFLPDLPPVTISEELFTHYRPFVYLEDDKFKETLNTLEAALEKQHLQKPVIQTKAPVEEFIIPLNFQGRIVLTFDAGEIKIRKEIL